LCAARGHFVHVYVDRATRRPAALPPVLIHALEGLRL
jgi:acyl-CoA thioester hydrolase